SSRAPPYDDVASRFGLAGNPRLFFDEMSASIPLITVFCLFITHRPVFAIACNLQLRAGASEILQIYLRRLGALFTEHHVVGLCTALIAMAFDKHVLALMRTEPPGILIHRLYTIGADSETIVIKVDVLEFAPAGESTTWLNRLALTTGG